MSQDGTLESELQDETSCAGAYFGVVSAWYPSKHDGDRLVWMEEGVAPEGPLTDAEIDALLARGALELIHSTFGRSRPASKRAIERAWLAGARRAVRISSAARLRGEGKADEARSLVPAPYHRSLEEMDAIQFLASSLQALNSVASAFDAGLSKPEMAGSQAAIAHVVVHKGMPSEDVLQAQATEWSSRRLDVPVGEGEAR